MEAENAAPDKSTKKQRVIKTLIFLLVLVFVALLIPKTYLLKDGGTKEYRAALYTVTKWHAFRQSHDDGYDGKDGEQQFVVGVTVEILGMKVYENKRYALESELKGG